MYVFCFSFIFHHNFCCLSLFFIVLPFCFLVCISCFCLCTVCFLFVYIYLVLLLVLFSLFNVESFKGSFYVKYGCGFCVAELYSSYFLVAVVVLSWIIDWFFLCVSIVVILHFLFTFLCVCLFVCVFHSIDNDSTKFIWRKNSLYFDCKLNITLIHIVSTIWDIITSDLS